MSEIEIIKDKVCFDEIVEIIDQKERDIILTGTDNRLGDFYKIKCYDEIVQILKDRGYIWTEKQVGQ